jgi:xanthine dehydrogenase YagT iron-sulfur-binding subunit
MAQDSHDKEEIASGPGQSSRRSFLKGVGASGLAASLSPLSAAIPVGVHSDMAASSVRPRTSKAPEIQTSMVEITLNVNGQNHIVQIDPRASLLDTLRETLHLTGTKKGCDHGQCGACTVHINGRRANSCLSLALTNQGDKITTIEGLGTPNHMHPMQAAFAEHDGFQCGYCTSGQIMSASAVVYEPWGPEDADVKEAMSGNICRCGAYSNIVDAIQQVRKGAK